MLRKVLSAYLLFIVAAVLRPSSLTATEPFTVADAPDGEIPFEFVQGHLISVHGSVGSTINLQFLVDFGTTYTLLDRSLVKERERGAPLDVTHFSNSIRASEVVVPELRVGSVIV